MSIGLKDMLKDRATVSRASAQMIDGNVRKSVFATVATDVPCRLETSATGMERVSAGGERLQYDRKCWFLRTADVADGDQVTISGTTYDVIHVSQNADAPQATALLKVR